MATVTENSDDTSSCCFPPKASTLDAVGVVGVVANHNNNNPAISPAFQVWEGSCSDRKAPGRHPLIDSTNKGVQNNSNNNNHSVFTANYHHGSSAKATKAEPLLGSGRSHSSASSGASEGGASHDPFTPSQSYASSETMLPAGSSSHLMLGGGSSVSNTTLQQPHHSLEQTLDQHVPQLMRLIHEEEDEDEQKQQPTPTSTVMPKQTKLDSNATTFVPTPAAQPMGTRRYPHQNSGASSKKGINPNAPQFTLSYSASPFVPGGTSKAKANNNNQQKTEADEQQQQIPPVTPPSNASCFSVTSYNGDGSELPVDCQDTKQLQKAGCEFIPAPFSITKADPVISRPAPGEDFHGVKEVFVGQLPFDFNPAALCEALARLVNTTTDASQIFTRFKMGPKPTCAFLTVKEPFASAMLELTKKILCDNNGMWVARSFNAEQGLNHVSKRRMALKKPGIPQKPMVLESVNQASHAPNKGGGHQHQQHRNNGQGNNGGSTANSMMPPNYHNHPAAGNSRGSQNPNSTAFAAGGSFVPPGSVYPMGGGFIPNSGIGAGHHYSYQTNNTIFAPQAHSSPFSNAKQQQQPQMSVCLCGAQHVVAMLNGPSTCTMCTLPLPSGVMVRQCQKCPESDICTRCVAMANKTMQHQTGSSSGRNSDTGSNHSQ